MSRKKLTLKFLSRHPLLIVLNILLGFSGAIFNGVSTVMIVPLLMAFLGQGVINFQKGPPFLQKIISLFDNFPESQRLFFMFLSVVLAIILKNIATYSASIVSTYLSRNLMNDMRLDGLKLLLDVDLDFYAKNRIGTIFNSLNQEITRATSSAIMLINITVNVITVTVFVVILITLSWQLTLVSLAVLSFVALLNQFFVKRAKYFGKILSQKSSQYTNRLIEILTGIRLIKTASNEKQEYQLIEQVIKDREKSDLEAQANSALIGPFNEIAGILTVLIIVIAARYLFPGQLKSFAPILLTYLLFLFRLLPLIAQLNGSRSKLANLSNSVNLATQFLRRDNKPFMEKGTEIYTDLQTGIRFADVYFSYPSHKEVVLKGIDLWIPKGKIIALVGSSGSGKSTIADLLTRLYDPTTGHITIDGKDIKLYDLRSLRQAMGIVSQDTFLFNNTVDHNIAYGLEDVKEEEIIEAAKAANAYEFIIKLPKGFKTKIGDRGILLSGGQKQRLAIARALLRNPEILILDEATSALDTVSEKLVQQAIDTLSQNRTTLVVAHRLSTVQKAYQIVVLDKGKIVEVGNHEELLNKGGYYTRLYSMQFDDVPKAKVDFLQK